MKTIEELKNEWNVDCVIDELKLQEVISSTPVIHAKYLGELVQYKLRLAKLYNEQSEYKALRTRYYRGELSKEELETHGWPQWQIKTIRGDIEPMILAEQQYQVLLTRESYYKAAIFFLESVIQEIRSRSFHCKNLIEWHKFRAGA